MNTYRVALWQSTLSPLPIATIPVQARDTRAATILAMQEHKATSMGVVVVMNNEGQQAYYDVCLAGQSITWSSDAWSPRFSESGSGSGDV